MSRTGTVRTIASASLLLAGVSAGRPLAAEMVNQVVLRVNDRIATLYDYRERKEGFIQEVTRRERDPEERRRLIEQAGEIVFKDIFDDLLLQSRADQLGVEVTPEQIDRSIAQMKQGYGIRTDEEFTAALQQSGMTMEDLRQQVETNLRSRDVLGREVNSEVSIEEEDLRRYYRKNIEEFRVPEQVSLREVVVLEERVPTAEERLAIAGEIAAAVAAGKPLAEAVGPFQDRGVTSGVIDLGWVSPGDLDPGLEAAAWKLAPGALSAPVEGRGGLHLLQVAERKESHVKPFNEVSSQIEAKEQERVFREKYAEYMAELQKSSLIVANPPQEAANFRRLIGPSEAGGLDVLGGEAAAEDTGQPAAPVTGEAATTPPGAPGGLPDDDTRELSPEPAIPPPPGDPEPPPPGR